MSRPLPRSVQKSRAGGKLPADPERPDRWKLLGVWAIACCVLLLLAVAAARSWVAPTGGKKAPVDRGAEVARRLETNNEWFEKSGGESARRLDKLVEEAKSAGMVPSHTSQKTSLMKINLRKLAPAAKPRDDEKPAVGEPAESGALGQRPSTPAPRAADGKGRVLPGGGGGDTALPDEPAQE